MASELPTMEDALDELKLELPRSRKVYCPMHDEGQPSLHIYEDNWYCFSCHKTGDGIGLIAAFTGANVRTLIAQRLDGTPQGHRRVATKGLTRQDVQRAVWRQFRDVHNWWFGVVNVAYADSYDWALLRALDLWSQMFDELADRLRGTGMFDDEDKPAPHIAERLIEEHKAELQSAEEAVMKEGKRTRIMA